MKVAIPCTEDDQIFAHFGHATEFAIYEHNGGDYVDRNVITTKCQGHEQIAQIMRYLHINIVVCDGIGDGAIDALTNYGILVYGGVKGNINQAYYDLVAGRLVCTGKPTCVSHNCSCSSGGCSCGCGK